MMDNLEKTYLSTYFLCVFKKLRDDNIFKNFVELLKNILKEDNLEKNIVGLDKIYKAIVHVEPYFGS